MVSSPTSEPLGNVVMTTTRPVLQTKLNPPSISSDILLVRPHLLTRLNRVWQRRLALVVAPAGYGKTSLLTQWVARQPQEQVAWYSMDAGDANWANFLAYFCTALEPVLPHVTNELQEMIANESIGHERVWRLLLQDLSNVRSPFILILDDAHHLARCPELLTFFDRILRHASPHFHIIMATRQVPPIPAIASLRVAGQIVELNETHLRFPPQDVQRLFRDIYGLPLTTRTAKWLTQRTEGWPVALQLAYQFGARYGRDKAEDLLRQFSGTVRELYDYLARVVLEGQPPTMREFLRRTSILDRLRPDMCNALLKRSDAAAMLARLNEQGLFTFPMDAGHTEYRYHPLFRDFLQRRLLEVEGEDIWHWLHRRAAKLFLEEGDPIQAVEHFLAAEDFVAAADQIRSLQGHLFATSRYHLLESWWHRFPPSFVQSNPWLLLVQAKVKATRGESARARDLYVRAETLFLKQGDKSGLYDVYHNMGHLHQSEGDFTRAREYYTRALGYAQTDETRGVLLGQIARCLYMEGQVEEALSRLEEGLTLMERIEDPLYRAGLLYLKGIMQSVVGDLRQGLDIFYRVRDLLETVGNRHQQIRLLHNMGYYHSLLGELDIAERLVRQGLELAQTFGRTLEYAYGLSILGEVYRRKGEYETAYAYYQEALTLQRRHNDRYELPVTLNWLGLMFRQSGDLDAALRWGLEGLERREKLGNDYETGLSLIDVGATYLERGDWEQAETLWRRALAIFEAANARYEQAQLHFYLAVLAQKREDVKVQDEHWERAETLACTYRHGDPPHCLFFFVEEAPWSASLLADALRRKRPTACIDCLLPRLGSAAREALLPLLSDNDPDVRERAITLLGRLGDVAVLPVLTRYRRDASPRIAQAAQQAVAAILSSPPPPLRVRCLGDFQVWRGDQPITHWGRTATKIVFQLLLERHPNAVPMDVLIEVLWPGGHPTRTRKNLHQAVKSLRRALEPELPSGSPSRYVEVGEGTYRLVLPPGSYVDWMEFERRIKRLLTQNDPDLSELAETLRLYQGDYLPDALYQDWAVLRREQLRELYIAGLIRLGQSYLVEGRHQESIYQAQRVLSLDPWNEEATLLLMQAYQQMNNIPAALRAYEALHERLQTDLDLPPREDLTFLYEHLRRFR